MDEFVFEEPVWEQTLDQLESGDCLSAARFLTFMEGEDEEQVDAAFNRLLEKKISLDVSDLPKATAAGENGKRLAFELTLAQVADMRSGLEETDPLRVYLEELARIPVAGDVHLLAKKLAEGDHSQVVTMVDLLLSRVVDLSKEYVGCGVLLLDLIQEGSLGLWRALQTYHGGDVESYCDWYVRQYMTLAAIRQAREVGLGQKMLQAMEDYRDIDQKLLVELGRNPTGEEIAEALHMTLQEVLVVAEMLDSAKMLQRAKAAEETEVLPEEEDQAVEDTAYFQMRQRISELLSSLSAEDAGLLTMRYGLEGGIPMKPQQVAVKLGITEEEVTALEAAALMKLRENH